MKTTKNTLKIAIAVLTITLPSCEIEKKIPYDFPYGGDRIIVHGYISPQEGAHVLVKKSIPLGKTTETGLVSNAIVTLFEDNNAVETLDKVSSSEYRTRPEFVPVIGKNYSIRVDVDGFEPLSSSLQPLVESTAIDSVSVYVDNSLYSNSTILEVWFTNNQPSQWGYQIKYSFFKDGEIIRNVSSPTMGYTDDTLSVFSNNYIFVDAPLEGENYHAYNLFRVYYDSVIVSLHTLSPDLTSFLTSRNEQTYENMEMFNERPLQVLSNIENGFGVFGSQSSTQVTFIAPPDQSEPPTYDE